jgi:mRNA-degrading endonuclease YafQ of YafQ-DinJ toxin-antitoxin module
MKYRIAYYPGAVREYKKFPVILQEKVKETFELLKDKSNHEKIKVHKLKGKLQNHFSCSVDYSNRIIFYIKEDEIRIVSIGNHDIYKNL